MYCLVYELLCLFISGCVIYMVIFGGLWRSFGIYFLEFQQRFRADAAEIAVMFSIQNITISVSGTFES